MGMEKSSSGRLPIRLFGEANAIINNNINKQTGRFNITHLLCKLVVCGEVNRSPHWGIVWGHSPLKRRP